MMKTKIFELIFVVAFVLCGCGIDSIFSGVAELITWLVTAGVALAAAAVLGSIGKERDI